MSGPNSPTWSYAFGETGSSLEGVEMKQANRRRKSIPAAAVLAERIRDTGVTVAGLAAEFGVSKSKVARDLNDAGYRSNGQPTFQSRPAMSENARLPHVSHTYVAEDGRLDGAACVGENPEMWFPNTVGERRIYGAQAKTVCGRCPVRESCLILALEEEAAEGLRYGIRGGLDEAERSALVESGAA